MSQKWQHDKVIYQIYPRSFQDTTGNGYGDLQGIIQHLDYLQWLGVDILWLTPIYPSSQVDNGYDVTDYCAIDPLYGSLNDFDQLLAEAHQRNILIMMDMVFNHTSTAHPWFINACDPTSPWHPFYLWCDGSADQLPTNWRSKFGGSAWQWQPQCQKYYLHLFSAQQADLNWRHPALRQELHQICRFWAARGVDAFRFDVINLIGKPAVFSDDPLGDGRQLYTDRPEVHDYLAELNRAIFTPLNLITVGELSSSSLAQCCQYAAVDNSELTLIYDFHHLKVDYVQGNKWSLAAPDWLALKQIFCQWQQGMHQRANSALCWSNHDQPRAVSRFGHELWPVHSAKMLAILLYAMQGTPTLYQGEEIGMTNANFSDIADYRDIESLQFYDDQRQQGQTDAQILGLLAAKSRDNSRTPMQWSNQPHAGFSQGTPWIACTGNYQQINVDAALDDPNSILHTYRRLIQLRRQYPILLEGSYQDLLPDSTEIWCYRRCWQHQQLLVVANLQAVPVSWSPPAALIKVNGQLLISNYPPDFSQFETCQLHPFQACWWLIETECTASQQVTQ